MEKGMVTWDNYEAYLITYADGELQPHEEDALMAFIALHPELNKELALFESARLTVDTEITYTNKQVLLQPQPAARKLFLFTNWRTLSVAAGLALVVITGGLAWYNSTFRTVEMQPVVHKKSSNTVNPIPTNINSTQNTTPKTTVNEAIAQTNTKHHSTASASVSIPQPTTPTTQKQQVTIAPHTAPSGVAIAATPKENVYLTALPLGQPTLREVSKVAQDPITYMANTPQLEIIHVANPKSNWIDKLPIDDLKKEGLANSGAALDKSMQAVSNLAQSIKEHTVTLRVDRKKLIVTF